VISLHNSAEKLEHESRQCRTLRLNRVFDHSYVRPCVTNFFLLRPYRNDYGNWWLRRNDYGDLTIITKRLWWNAGPYGYVPSLVHIEDCLSVALFTRDFFAHNIAIIRYCDKKIKRHFSTNIFFHCVNWKYLFLFIWLDFGM